MEQKTGKVKALLFVALAVIVFFVVLTIGQCIILIPAMVKAAIEDGWRELNGIHVPKRRGYGKRAVCRRSTLCYRNGDMVLFWLCKKREKSRYI